MMAQIRELLSGVEWNHLLLVFLCGSLGGLCYWFYLLYDAYLAGIDPDPRFVVRWLIVMPAVLFLGGFTALVGVFYISGNQIDDVPRALVLAMVFGFSFNSVLQYLNESRSRALHLEQAENATADLTRENAELRTELRTRELPGDSSSHSEALVDIRTAQTDRALDGLRESTTRSAREKFVSFSKELILDIESTALSARSNDGLLRALQKLGNVGTAATQVSDSVSLQALLSMHNISQAALRRARTGNEVLGVLIAADQPLIEIARSARSENRGAVANEADRLRLQLARSLNVRGDDSVRFALSAGELSRATGYLERMRRDFPEEIFAALEETIPGPPRDGPGAQQ